MLDDDDTAIRRYVRQVTGIPVSVTLDFDDTPIRRNDTLTNVSLGGLCFIADDRLEQKAQIDINFPLLDKEECFSGTVVWCEKTDRGYEVGLEFDDLGKVQQMKVVEQICEFERFREEMEALKGRKLSAAEVAREWSSFYAGDFSALN